MMSPEFGESETIAAQKLIALAFAEDLQEVGDLTCRAMIDENERAEVNLVARSAGVVSGLPVAELVFSHFDREVCCEFHRTDGETVEEGTVAATFSGRLRSLLTGERTVLNFLTHLSGVASLTSQYISRVAGTDAKILDTRKTLPGWRILEKYAVRCGGGTNHRMGLYDGILIKDNHLANWASAVDNKCIADAIREARQSVSEEISIEVEVDTLEQLEDALNGSPDIVLLDNMSVAMLEQAIEMRKRIAADVLLEASGGISLESVTAIARTGVERISVGALTHSAIAMDFAFDWKGRVD